jgi:hypothetical protein
MKRHRTDLVSLIFGLVFLVIAGEWLLAGRMDVDLPALGWLAALVLIVLGVVGLVGAVRSPRDEETPAESDHSIG